MSLDSEVELIRRLPLFAKIDLPMLKLLCFSSDRLTFDMGLGYETQVAPDIYFYTEARLLIPTTEYPSDYLFVNEDAPLAGSINLGVRLFFNNWK